MTERNLLDLLDDLTELYVRKPELVEDLILDLFEDFCQRLISVRKTVRKMKEVRRYERCMMEEMAQEIVGNIFSPRRR